MAPLSRRAFLRLLGGSAIVVLPVLQGCSSDPDAPQPLIAPTAGTTGALPELPERLLTPVKELYRQYYGSIAELDVATWTFTIDGSVATPVTLRHADFLAMPQTSLVTTMECIGNQVGGTQIGNVEWTGVLWQELQARYGGTQASAVEWRFSCGDGYVTTLPIERLKDPAVLLAHSMNGEPIPTNHGAPLRIIIPGKYGQKQPKWLTSMTAIDTPELGFWEKRGWSNTAEIMLHSMTRQIQEQRVNSSHATAQIPLGPAVVAGVALDRDRAIERVEVSTDDGVTWSEAQINHPPTAHEWTLWQYAWTPPAAGTYRVTSRAYADGVVQDIEDSDGSDGQAGNFVVKVTVG